VRVVVQRVTRAAVTVEGAVVGEIGPGLMVLVGFCDGDAEADLEWMARKLIGLRLFEDAEGKMNLSVGDVGAEILLVPQFTLYGDCRKGRRPGFSDALAPEQATLLFDRFCAHLDHSERPVPRGIFGAHMQVSLVNDGPVTLIIDSPADPGVRSA
jgi:D-aminoacyl-tRNA deacylase